MTDATFEQWMREVDSRLSDETGSTSDDLADYLYYDAYDTGMAPGEVVSEVLYANGYSEVPA